MRLNEKFLISWVISCYVMTGILAAPVSENTAPMEILKLFKLISQRFQRQVVQPTWLMDGDEGAGPQNSFSNIEVSPESLQEAAEIRESIQKAIKEGLFTIRTGFEGAENFVAPSESGQSWLPPHWSWPLQWTWQWPILTMLGAAPIPPEANAEVETTTVPPPPPETTTESTDFSKSMQKLQENWVRMLANSKLSFNWEI